MTFKNHPNQDKINKKRFKCFSSQNEQISEAVSLPFKHSGKPLTLKIKPKQMKVYKKQGLHLFAYNCTFPQTLTKHDTPWDRKDRQKH